MKHSFLSLIFLLTTISVLNFSCSKDDSGGNTPPNTVNILDDSFSPSSLTVAKGTAVTWKNLGASEHTVTSDTGSELDSGTMESGDTFTHTFNTAGTYPYYCIFHGSPGSGMIGTVIVTP
ncbi:MAG: plastocyanin/azurin family copper-binding protein [Bacteroidota bacterium]